MCQRVETIDTQFRPYVFRHCRGDVIRESCWKGTCINCVYFLVHKISVRWVELDFLNGTYNIMIGDESQSFTAKSSLRSHQGESMPRIFYSTLYIQQLTVLPTHLYVF
jgi:hypothetical protein